jgi:Tol biopolymer transport system component
MADRTIFRREVLEARVTIMQRPSNASIRGVVSSTPICSRMGLSIATSSNANIWIWDLVREALTRLTLDALLNVAPLWTRDGKRIFFVSMLSGRYGLFSKASDGTGRNDQLGGVPAIGNLFPQAWSGDGNSLILMQYITSTDIGAVSMEDERKWRLLLKEKYNEIFPQISPDGKWMAYPSNESGRYEVFVRPFSDVESGGRWQVSTGGGESPLWSPGGRELFYRNGDATMSVDVETKPKLKPGKPKLFFEGHIITPLLVQPLGTSAPMASVS